MRYAVVEISGRQYKIESGKSIFVDFLGENLKTFDCDKVLLLAKDGNLEIGMPYLKEKLTFDVLGSQKGEKIRVAKYHAKSNYRMVKGARRMTSQIRLQDKIVKTK